MFALETPYGPLWLLLVDSLKVGGAESHVVEATHGRRPRAGRGHLYSTAKRLVPPSYSEGFDELFRVRLTDGFEVRAEPRD